MSDVVVKMTTKQIAAAELLARLIGEATDQGKAAVHLLVGRDFTEVLYSLGSLKVLSDDEMHQYLRQRTVTE